MDKNKNSLTLIVFLVNALAFSNLIFSAELPIGSGVQAYLENHNVTLLPFGPGVKSFVVKALVAFRLRLIEIEKHGFNDDGVGLLGITAEQYAASCDVVKNLEHNNPNEKKEANYCILLHSIFLG